MALRLPPPVGNGSGFGGRRRERRLDVPRRREMSGGRGTRGVRIAPHLVLPLGHVRAVQLRARSGDHHRAVRFPGVLVFAHPLHPHGAAGEGRRDERSVGACVVRAVVAVAAGAFHVDAAHALARHAKHLGDRVAQRIDALRVRPDRERAVLRERDGARGADRRVHLVRTPVARADDAGSRRELRRFANVYIVLRRQALKVGVQRSRAAGARPSRSTSPRVRARAWRRRPGIHALPPPRGSCRCARSSARRASSPRGRRRPTAAARRSSAAARRARAPCLADAGPARRSRSRSLSPGCRHAARTCP